jgi:hypothetical protein
MLNEHAADLSAASPANGSRRLIKRAKVVIATVLSQLPRFKAAMTQAIQPAYYRNNK